MSGECDKRGEHTLDCLCVSQDICEVNIDVYITISELEKLSKFVDFLPAHHYPAHYTLACKEVGKIGILGGPTLKFHFKRPEMPIKTPDSLDAISVKTYKVDNNTIGVRPIWFDVKHNLPKKAGVYWVAYELNGRLKSHYCLWEEKSKKYQGSKWGWRSREAVRRENIRFWMEIPKPPCQADEKINSEK